MGATVFHSLTATTPDDTSFEIRPLAHWNQAHVVSIDTSLSNINISAGSISRNLSALTFSDGSGVSWGLNTNSVLTATVKTDYQTSGAYLTTARASNDAVGLNTAQSNVTWTVNSSGVSLDARGYAGTATGATGGSLTVNSGGVSMNLPAYLTTAALSGDTSKYVQNWKLTGNSTGTQSTAAGTDLWLAGGQGITLSGSSNSISFSVGSYITTADLSANSSNYARNWKLTGNSAGTQSSAIGTDLWLAGGQGITLSGSSNSVSFSVGSYITTADLSQNSSLYAQSVSLFGNTAGTQTFSGTRINLSGGQGITLSGNASTIVLSVGSYITTARASTDAIGLNTAQTNVTWTVNSSGLSLNAAGYAGTGTTLTNASATLNSNGLQLNVPFVTLSSYENFPLVSSSSLTVPNGVSVSAAVQFLLPQAGSFSFMRLPVSFTTNSTTFATTGASLSASAQIGSTWNAVVYSLGTGASSRSLQFVASGSAGWTVLNSVSVAANGTQYSVTQAISGFAEGNGTTVTSQYSISNTNYSFVSTGPINSFNGIRYLDINFANSLSAGQYWAIIGYSSSSATNSTGIQPASNANISFSYGFGMSQASIAPRVMGSANNSASGIFGAGSFSTAGGGTTNSLDISAITSNGSNVRMYLQLLRSA